jgi:Zn-dependent peptidase ImmA (M78 family)
MITDQRKKRLSELAYFIAQSFMTNTIVQLEEISSSEEITIHFDHYEEYFDGMLLYDDPLFHIHINIDRGNFQNSKRGRFTLAHELSHFFIDEHRLGLKSGELQPHPSKYEVGQKNIIEYEADYFASCLLMPEAQFRLQAREKGKKFSLDTVLKLSDTFQTSVLSIVLKFAEIGTHEITAVISKDNIVKWYAQTKDFPKWPFKFKVGSTLPPTSVAGEFFAKKNEKYTGVEEVNPDDWFYPKWTAKTQMHEQCYYSESYGYVISLIWFD